MMTSSENKRGATGKPPLSFSNDHEKRTNPFLTEDEFRMQELALRNQRQEVTPEEKDKGLRDWLCKQGFTDDEYVIFKATCIRTQLDPFMRQIYPVKRWNSTTKKNEMTIQVGIDGFRLIADRTGKFSPGRETTFAYDAEGRMISATAYIKKLTPDGTWHEVSATCFYNEFVQTTKEGRVTQFWAKMPHVMLGKCAEATAIRRAFPHDLSGLYIKEEMDQSKNGTIEVEIEENEAHMSDDERLDVINRAKNSLEGQDSDKVLEYLMKYAEHYGMDIVELCKAALSDQEGFKVKYLKWVNKKG